jgi:hypothetical protein
MQMVKLLVSTLEYQGSTFGGVKLFRLRWILHQLGSTPLRDLIAVTLRQLSMTVTVAKMLSFALRTVSMWDGMDKHISSAHEITTNGGSWPMPAVDRHRMQGVQGDGKCILQMEEQYLIDAAEGNVPTARRKMRRWARH